MLGKAMPSGSAEAASAPRQAAAAAAATAAAASATATAATTAAATATATAAASARFLNTASDLFLVEEVERRQADVGDFFFAECDGMGRCVVRGLRRIRRWHR